MSLIDTEIAKLRARAQQVIQHLRQQLALLEEAVQAQDWDKLRTAELLREQSLEGDMRLDRRCARILALHQPVANDLRLVLAVLRMHFYVDEISERIATISRRLANFAPQLPEGTFQTIPLAKLVYQVRRLLEMCLDAFFREDTPRSKSIDTEDQAVDNLYETCMRLIVAQLTTPPFTGSSPGLDRTRPHRKNLRESGGLCDRHCRRLPLLCRRGLLLASVESSFKHRLVRDARG